MTSHPYKTSSHYAPIKSDDKAQETSQTDFNWDAYFKDRHQAVLPSVDQMATLYEKVRHHLQEDPFKISLVLTTLMRKLLKEVPIPRDLTILELGAATGFLTRWLLDEYGGKGTLVDNNPSSHDAFECIRTSSHYDLTYIMKDIFDLDSQKKFDIVCSFGLVEHFPEKDSIMLSHAKFAKQNGYAIVLVPLDTPLSRVYWDIHQELNLGYRELLSERQFNDMFYRQPNFELISTAKSYGYAYDFIAGIARINTEKS